MSTPLIKPEETGLVPDLPLSLELLVARDVTLLLSKERPRILNSNKMKKQQRTFQKIENSSHALAPVSHALGFHDAFPLIPATLLDDELQWIGVYGIGVDSHTNHTWFSTNYIHFLHELDPTFDLVKAHPNQKYPRAWLSPTLIANFRQPRFIGDDPTHYHAYITDAGNIKSPALHVFRMPGFKYEKTIDLSAVVSACFSPTHIIPYQDRLLIGCVSGGRSCRDLTNYQVLAFDPKTEALEKITIDGVVHLFVHDGTLYGMSDHRNEKGVRWSSTLSKYFLFRFQEEGFSPAEVMELEMPSFTIWQEEMHVDKRGYLYRAGVVYNKETDAFDPTLAIADIKGRKVVSSPLPFSFSALTFDHEGDLIALLHVSPPSEQEHLVAVKYRIHYNF